MLCVCGGVGGHISWAISNTLHKFMHYLDSGSGDLFAQLFSTYGCCEVVKFGRIIRGTAALSEFCVGTHLKFKDCEHWYVYPAGPRLVEGRTNLLLVN